MATMLAWAWFATRPPDASPPLLADRVVVSKSAHTLTLLRGNQPLRVYHVALGRVSGAKREAGDQRTPEGHYRVDGHHRGGCCHAALHLSYPDAGDRKRAAAAHQQPGRDIEIHGIAPALSFAGPVQHLVDWTHGCIAVSNGDMDEIYKLVPVGTPVDISP
jgi:murein L,D-transpeptidase YafK